MGGEGNNLAGYVVQFAISGYIRYRVARTVVPSLSMSTPSWLRNLLPMLMNASLPICWTDASRSKIFFTSGFLLSVTSAARDVCSASLFFSMNCAYTSRNLR